MSTPVESVRAALAQVTFPGARVDVVGSGVVRGVAEKDGGLAVEVVLPALSLPGALREALLAELLAAARAAAPGAEIRLEVRAEVARRESGEKLPTVKNIVAVASGKGGVGKLTVAVNLAWALARGGASVGLFDADVFGPSIPKMLGEPARPAGGVPPHGIEPALIREPGGLELRALSIGYFVPESDAVVWRGPMVHKLLQQFAEDVVWGDLDYLVIDLPPGTGDVHISLTQLLPLGGAVMVTTPQDVALADVRKGVAMFERVGVPILGVVENMAVFVCPSCGHAEEIFSRGGGKLLAAALGVPFLGEVPIDTRVRQGGDAGRAVVLEAPESPVARALSAAAELVASTLAARALSAPRKPKGLNVLK